jgi:TrmH family RNA methyltransferase
MKGKPAEKSRGRYYQHMTTEPILLESRNNPLVKTIRGLSSAKERAASGLHRIEGDKLVRDAVQSGAQVETILMEEGFPFSPPPEAAVYRVTRSVLESVSTTDTPQHLCAVVHTPDTTPPPRFPAGLIVLLDGVQDPGNLGAILRSADAFGAKGVLFNPGCADPFSPKSLRAAMGSTYHLPLWRGDVQSALRSLKQQGFTAVCGHLQGKETLPKLGENTALVIGSEGRGVSSATADECYLFRLPMQGRAESLNAAVAAGILIFLTSRSELK